MWRLFRDKPAFAGLPLYATIQRALRTRSAEEYAAVAGEVRAQGFKTFKCAPFEAVTWTKRRRLRRLAGLWRDDHPGIAAGAPLRIDVISILRPRQGRAQLEHLRGAC